MDWFGVVIVLLIVGTPAIFACIRSGQISRKEEEAERRRLAEEG